MRHGHNAGPGWMFEVPVTPARPHVLPTGRLDLPSESAIGRAAWPDARHRHHVGSVVDLIEDSVFAYPDSKKSPMVNHRLHSVRPRLIARRAYEPRRKGSASPWGWRVWRGKR